MVLDKDYKVPEGFKPRLGYHDDSDEGIPIVGVARLEGEGPPGRENLDFYVGDKVPVLPLKGCGLFWDPGWDIPTLWVVDGARQCWMNDGHGGYLDPIDRDRFLAACAATEKEEVTNHLRELLGMDPLIPEWQRKALEAGWTPPK